MRVRDLALPPGVDVHDVTVTARIGLALAAPERLRALPAFVGLAARYADQRTTLVVLEWNLGVTTP